MKSLKDARQKFDQAVHGAASITILRKENEEITQKALDDMSTLTFKKTHDDVVRNRLDNSGQWLLEHEKFGKWLHGDILTLWCPGEGKPLSYQIFYILNRGLIYSASRRRKDGLNVCRGFSPNFV